VGVEATLRAGNVAAGWMALVFVAVSLTACGPDAPKPSGSTMGIAVVLVLLPDPSNGCCVVVSVNEEERPIRASVRSRRSSPMGG